MARRERGREKETGRQRERERKEKKKKEKEKGKNTLNLALTSVDFVMINLIFFSIVLFNIFIIFYLKSTAFQSSIVKIGFCSHSRFKKIEGKMYCI